MIGQVSQIRSIELSKNLTDALSQITSQQRTAGASDLLGKYVTATVANTDGSKQDISGVVTGVRFDSDGTRRAGTRHRPIGAGDRGDAHHVGQDWAAGSGRYDRRGSEHGHVHHRQHDRRGQGHGYREGAVRRPVALALAER